MVCESFLNKLCLASYRMHQQFTSGLYLIFKRDMLLLIRCRIHGVGITLTWLSNQENVSDSAFWVTEIGMDTTPRQVERKSSMRMAIYCVIATEILGANRYSIMWKSWGKWSQLASSSGTTSPTRSGRKHPKHHISVADNSKRTRWIC